jgi:hypothetical protein
MRQIVRDLKPSGLEDISSVLALYRPGPLDAGLIPKFINRKHGREKIDFAHEILQPILKETYGIMVYQEQIMKIAQDMAGYSLGQADLLRRAMGKKKMSEMEKHKGIFMEAGVHGEGGAEEGGRGTLGPDGQVCGILLQQVPLHRLRLCHLPDRLPEGQLSRGVHGGTADRQQRRSGQGADAHRQLHLHGH